MNTLCILLLTLSAGAKPAESSMPMQLHPMPSQPHTPPPVPAMPMMTSTRGPWMPGTQTPWMQRWPDDANRPMGSPYRRRPGPAEELSPLAIVAMVTLYAMFLGIIVWFIALESLRRRRANRRGEDRRDTDTGEADRPSRGRWYQRWLRGGDREKIIQPSNNGNGEDQPWR